LVIDCCRERNIVKDVCEILPDVSVSVFTAALVVETVHLGDLLALMVASKDCEPISESKFKSQKETHCFY